MHLSNGEVELLRLQEAVKLHIKASEMNANEKSKLIKLIFFSRTISKSLAGASVDKAMSQGCFSAKDEQEVPQGPASA